MRGTGLDALPAAPGAYLFRDRLGEILYVGKARNLRRRVRSYFRAGERVQSRTRAMLERVSTIDALVVRTERDALLLEAALIKTHRPRYNRKLKDSRGYPYLEIALHHPMPRVRLTYRTCDERALYFGPFPEARALRDALRVIRRLYTLNGESFERGLRERTAADHRRMAVDMLDFLAGRSLGVRQRVDRAMLRAVRRLDFERAARLRETRDALDALAARPSQYAARATDVPPRVVAHALPRIVARLSVELAGDAREPAVRSRPPDDAAPPDPGSRRARLAGR